MTTYAPGQVCVATVTGVTNLRVSRSSSGSGWRTLGTGTWYGASEVTDVRPLVVLDLDDMHCAEHAPKWLRANAEDIDRQSVGASSIGKQMRWLADQIEAQTRPPKPEVYEHLGIDKSGVGNPHIFTALCGKVWVPGQDVTVVGRCPNCAQFAKTGWMS